MAEYADHYDNVHQCVFCKGSNELLNPLYESYQLHEAQTKCQACGEENYWAYGRFQYSPEVRKP